MKLSYTVETFLASGTSRHAFHLQLGHAAEIIYLTTSISLGLKQYAICLLDSAMLSPSTETNVLLQSPVLNNDEYLKTASAPVVEH